MAHQLHEIGHLCRFVQGVVVADRPYEGPEVEKIKNAILKDYEQTVFADKHDSDPPIRGPFGEATIELKPGVTPLNNAHLKFVGNDGKFGKKSSTNLS